MTKSEILENNKLIAEFMGYKYIPYKDSTTNYCGWWRKGDYVKHSKSSAFLGRAHKNLRYHSSWDWLMPVVEKIESLSANVTITGLDCEIYTLKDDDYDFTSSYNINYRPKLKIKAIYLATIEFIKWYNENA